MRGSVERDINDVRVSRGSRSEVGVSFFFMLVGGLLSGGRFRFSRERERDGVAATSFVCMTHSPLLRLVKVVWVQIR